MRHSVLGAAVLFAALAASSCYKEPGIAPKRDGKSLFYNFGGCSNCHRVNNEKLVGPGLAGTSKIHSEAWLGKWLSSPEKTWEENDAETQEMRTRLGEEKKSKPGMKLAREFEKGDVDALVGYLKTL